MPTQRISMRKIRDVLRLKAAGLSVRQIGASTKLSVGSIQKLITQAASLNLTWPLPEGLDDEQLARFFYPAADVRPAARLEEADWPRLHQELKRKGVTRQLLWEEYATGIPNRSYSYSQFCARYQDWQQTQKRSLRQHHRAGEKCFIDYCGPTVPIVDAATGEIRPAQIFVAVLGASNYTYAEATLSQSLPDWLHSHVRAFEFFGGVPELLVPDNLKSGVSRACRYEPDLNPAYQQLAEHYQVAILPARPRKPKDKAKVEVGVQIVERWILARLRHQTFFSLTELNHAIRGLLDHLNQRPFKQLPGNRQQAFMTLDQPALRPLPTQPYHYVAIKPVKVNIDYHVQFQQHFYSVPHTLVGETLELHAGDQQITLYLHQRQVATHVRKHGPGFTTVSAHMPVAHQQHQQWTPARLQQWGQQLGPDVGRWVEVKLASQEHPEQAYRACLGLLSLSRQYPHERLNSACALALHHGLYRVRNVKTILERHRDQLPLTPPAPEPPPRQPHENIRGPGSFH